MSARFVVALYAILAVTGVLSLSPTEKALFDWIREHGGEINVKTGVNKNGVRGIFASRAMKRGEVLARIPSSTILNIGNPRAFGEPAVYLLRELKNNCTRFKPYFDSLPETILNGCNFPEKYQHMFESESVERLVIGWRDTLKRVLTGEDNGIYPMTLKEAVGLAPVTLEEVQYACALTATRYVNAGQPRQSYILAAIFDLANHKHNCKNGIRYSDKTQDMFEFVAGTDLKKGQEICYHYGFLPDDYSIIHYGFLPKLEKPPIMNDVDRHTFNHQNVFKTPERTEFTGTRKEIEGEIKRLSDILSDLLARDVGKEEEDAKHEGDWLYDMMRQYQKRRRHSLKYEIKRLKGLLGDQTESQDADAEEL